MKNGRKNYLKQLLITIGIVLLLNLVSSRLFKRFDLTQDKRYTLSETSVNIVENVNQPIYVDVFLKGNFPGEFKRLQSETNQLLEEFKACNSNIIFRFTNPFDGTSDAEKKELIFNQFKIINPVNSEKEANEIRESIDKIADVDQELKNSFYINGLKPTTISINDKGKTSEEYVFPWAVVTYGNRSVKVPLLKDMMGASTEDKIVSSVQHLEYAFANAFNTISNEKSKKVAILKGNGELDDRYIGDFVKEVRENYGIGTFTLDSVATQPNETLKYLKRYDLVIIAKPIQRFSDAEKQVLDQYILGGGKTLWLIDQVNMEMDSLYNERGVSLAFPNDLGLTDMFFKYGIRLNPDLVKDIMATPIALATGEQGSATQYTQFPWLFAPMIYPVSKNPIVSNLDGIRFDFAGGIELLNNDIKKTVLLQSSAYSKLIGTPSEISLDMVQDRPDQAEFKGKGNIPVAVLLEGAFRSTYENRVLPFKDNTFVGNGVANKMIVVSDGDVIKNQLDKNGAPLELGYDKWTGKFYANKEFLMNCVNYLLDDTGLINIRSKEVNLPLLDKEKVYDQYTTSQLLTVGLPIVILGIFGFLFTFLRKRKYGR